MEIIRIDHLVLTVKNIEASCAFYTKVLGMKEATFQGGRKAVAFGNQKINFHEYGNEFDPKALHPTPGSADLCFITCDSIAQIISDLELCGVKIIEGPLERTGATGPTTSIYIRDPDQNLIEISVYNQEIPQKKG
ncbi:MAG: VOC family protein [Desulfobacterales bacterium]|jgi:catechol 2,3-dioxygenase-like lactoylglutathione lyase family enzyme